jgi:radical SAM superfamily enzyme YgiQ (UPF0313 family)
MRDSGCACVNIGVETGDQALMDSTLKKRLRLADVLRANRAAHATGMRVRNYYMVGLPGQGWRSVLASARFMLRSPEVSEINVSYAVPYPGSAMYSDPRVEMLSPRYRHGPEATQNLDDFACPTRSDVMTRGEIQLARDLLIELHRRIRRLCEVRAPSTWTEPALLQDPVIARLLAGIARGARERPAVDQRAAEAAH